MDLREVMDIVDSLGVSDVAGVVNSGCVSSRVRVSYGSVQYHGDSCSDRERAEPLALFDSFSEKVQ